MGNIKDLAGQRFGRLLVIEQDGKDSHRNIRWKCKCDCGNIKVILSGHLVSGRTKSCGCFMNEARIINNTTHGMSETPLYNVWRGMRSRCYLNTSRSYQDYGGRGIKVCEEWKDDFQAFYDYVSQLPHFGETGYSLDRINNDGNYEPGNVKWSTRKEQANNRRTSKH